MAAYITLESGVLVTTLGPRHPTIVDGDLYRRLCRARDLIHDRFDDALDLPTLAQAAGVSRFHFLRSFQRAFGQTPHQRLVDVRLARAKERLRAGAAVTEVCLDVGFSSLGSFSDLFRRRVGVSPSQYQLTFYTEKMGFEVRTDQSMGSFRWLTVGPKGQPELEIILSPVGMGPAATPEITAQLRALVERGSFGIGVYETDDCKATYEQMRARGVEFREPPAERPYGTEVAGRDNSGNWFVIVQRPRPAK
jgi:AraC-like DNA-binding protein